MDKALPDRSKGRVAMGRARLRNVGSASFSRITGFILGILPFAC
jgi:hypothetical protein